MYVCKCDCGPGKDSNARIRAESRNKAGVQNLEAIINVIDKKKPGKS